MFAAHRRIRFRVDRQPRRAGNLRDRSPTKTYLSGLFRLRFQSECVLRRKDVEIDCRRQQVEHVYMYNTI